MHMDTSTGTQPIAVITGAARGIGSAVAARLHREGHRVVIADVKHTLAEETARALGPGAYGHAVDVTDPQALEALIEHVERELGPIAVWVNNAGVMPTGPFAAQPLASLDAVVDVNFRGMLYGTRLVLPRMLSRGRGNIVSIASATAAHPVAGLAAYSGSKAAVVAFTRALRRELRGSGVELALVLPYLAQTAMGAGMRAQPGFRAVSADDVADSVSRALRRGGLVHFVPRALRSGAALLNALPLAVRDRVDDLLRTDAIGLGGDPEARRRYHDDTKR
jgi:short-subunit dehydrogenase